MLTPHPWRSPHGFSAPQGWSDKGRARLPSWSHYWGRHAPPMAQQAHLTRSRSFSGCVAFAPLINNSSQLM